MFPLYRDDHFTFRFDEDRIIPRFHLEGVEIGRRVLVFRLDRGSDKPTVLIASAHVGEGGWVEMSEPILVRNGEGFVVVPEPDFTAP